MGGDDPDAVADLVAESFANDHQSALGSSSSGREEYRRRLPGFFASLPARRYTVVESVVATGEAGAEVVVRYRLGAVVDAHRIDVPGVMWFTVVDGAITRRLDTWDALTYLRQSGQSPV